MLFQVHNMKIFLIPNVVLVVCFLLEAVLSEAPTETMSVHVNHSCSTLETECALGCCPFQDGVCCIDGFECCEHGKTCIPFIGICIGAEKDTEDKISLASSKSTPIRSSVFACPSGTTECSPGKCCVYEEAVCCPDGRHCCPNGYRCDEIHQKCIRKIAVGVHKNYYSSAALDKPLNEIVRQSPYKSCPGRKGICPSYMSCCVDDNGEWGCCPNPRLPEIKYGGGDCCVSLLYGYLCCPDYLPVCTIIGCL